MSEYRPDKWVVVEITNKFGDKYRRVLGSWYGGFTKSDSWRMSSGITSWHDRGDHYEIVNDSGSVYFCGKQNLGMSAYTMNVLASYQKDFANTGGSIEVVEIDS